MRKMISQIPLSEAGLHDAAIAETGLDDFGDDGYLQGLRALLGAFQTDLQLSQLGSQVLHDALVTTLKARLHTQRGWAEHPEVLESRIQKPLIVMGLPRTGTTALHKLLAVDQQFQGLEHWLGATPMIRPPRETWDKFPAYDAAVDKLRALYMRVPGILKMHEMVAGEVDECFAALAQNFANSAWVVIYGLPTYASWFFAQSPCQPYQRYAKVLQLIGAHEPHKRWLLKCPHHMFEIEGLLRAFPDACIVQTHRDPVESIPSLCNLVHTWTAGVESEPASPEEVGSRQCTHWRTALERMQSASEKFPRQFFDVDYRRFRSDPLGTVRSIYEFFGLRLAVSAEQQMSAWVSASPTSKHGKHEYSTSPWLGAEAQIREAFADYRARQNFD